jgi:hypothetical protein
VNEPVTVVSAKGRVFELGRPSGPEAIPEALVELETARGHEKIAAAPTDEQGTFELPTPPPGEYLLRVSLVGFETTIVPVRIKKGRRDGPQRIVVRLDGLWTDCSCGDACVTKSDRSGHVEAKCLVERKKASAMSVQPPNTYQAPARQVKTHPLFVPAR